MNSKIVNVNENSFETEVLNSKEPVLVDFWATWCGPCRQMAPILEDVATENNDLKVVKIDVDNNQVLASKYNISSIPTMMLFKNGEVEKIVIGARSKPSLESELLSDLK